MIRYAFASTPCRYAIASRKQSEAYGPGRLYHPPNLYQRGQRGSMSKSPTNRRSTLSSQLGGGRREFIRCRMSMMSDGVEAEKRVDVVTEPCCPPST